MKKSLQEAMDLAITDAESLGKTAGIDEKDEADHKMECEAEAPTNSSTISTDMTPRKEAINQILESADHLFESEDVYLYFLQFLKESQINMVLNFNSDVSLSASG